LWRAGGSTPTFWPAWARESEAEARAAIFAPYQVNAALMSHAAPDAVFLTVFPRIAARKVTDEVMESPPLHRI